MELDDRVLAILRENGRASYTDIAGRLGVPTSAASASVRRMLASGEVRISAIVNPELSRREYRAHVSVWAVGRVEPVLTLLQDSPEVRFLSTIGGLFSLVAEVHAGSRAELQRMLTQIRATPGVEAVNTAIFDRVFRFASHVVSSGTPSVALDDTDRDLIRVLQDDGRATFRELGRAVNLTGGAALLRFQRLVRDEVIQIGAIVRRAPDSRNVAMGLGINVRGDPAETAAELAAHRSVEFVATAIGRFDVIATISSTSLGELRAQLDDIHARTEVASLETWVHLEILRESYGL